MSAETNIVFYGYIFWSSRKVSRHCGSGWFVSRPFWFVCQISVWL